MARVENDTRLKIRRLHKEENLNTQQLAERFNLDQRTIDTILGAEKQRRLTLCSKADKAALKKANVPFTTPSPYNFGSRRRKGD
jgi:transposase